MSFNFNKFDTEIHKMQLLPKIHQRNSVARYLDGYWENILSSFAASGIMRFHFSLSWHVSGTEIGSVNFRLAVLRLIGKERSENRLSGSVAVSGRVRMQWSESGAWSGMVDEQERSGAESGLNRALNAADSPLTD